MAAEDTPVTGQNPLPPSQWVTGIGHGASGAGIGHGASGAGIGRGPATPAGEPADDMADTGSISRLPEAGADPNLAATRIEPPAFESAPTQLEVGPTRGGAPAGSLDATAPPSPRPPVPRAIPEETLPPSGDKAEVRRPTGVPPSPPRPPVGTDKEVIPIEELSTLPPGHVRAARRGRWLILLGLLLIPAAFFGGRFLRTGLLPRPGQPEITLESPAPGAWAETEVRVKGTAQGLVSGTAALGTQEVALGPAGQFELVIAGFPDGEHARTLVVRGRDAGGQPGEAKRPLVLRFDRAPPVLTVLDPVEGSQVAPGPLRVRYSAADAVGVQVALRLDGAAVPLPEAAGAERVVELLAGPLAAGPHELKVQAMDPAGHQVEVVRRFTAIEEPPIDGGQGGPRPPAPVVSISWPADGLLGRQGLLVRCEHASEVTILLDGTPIASTTPWRLDPASVKDGVHTLEAVARGPGGSAREARRFVRDTTAPELEVSFASGPSPLGLTGRVTDALDPRPALELEIDGGQPIPLTRLPAQVSLPPGPHTLVVTAEDLAGNRAQRRGSVTVSSEKPPDGPGDTGQTGTGAGTGNTGDTGNTGGTGNTGAGNPGNTGTSGNTGDTGAGTGNTGTDGPGTHTGTGTGKTGTGTGTGNAGLPPADQPLVRLPARSRGRVRVEAAVELPPGSVAAVDVAGSRLAAGPLPLEVTLGPGRHLVAVTVRMPQAPVRQSASWVEIDAQPPTIGALRAQPSGPDTTRVTADVRDPGPVELELFLDGTVVARALPYELRLGAGDHELVLVARDELENEARKVLVVRGPEQAGPKKPAEPAWPMDSGDPREEEAARLLASGKRREARDAINSLIESGQRGLRSPYVFRARLRLEYGKTLADQPRRLRILGQGLEDIKHAIRNYGSQAEARHLELEAQFLDALGRPTQAADVRSRARALGQ